MAAPPPKKAKTGGKDECWKYTIDFPGRGRNQTKCLFFKVINSGGINRLKYHIARIRGHDVEPCKDSPTKAQRFCYVSLEKHELAKELRKKQMHEIGQIGSRSTPAPPSTSWCRST